MDGFQRIMHTREYYQTRAEMDILFGQAAQMAQMLGELRQDLIRHLRIAERGPGDGLKTWRLLAALDAAGIPFTYFGIDCSMRALGRAATPDEVAAVIAFLASNDARFVNGVILPVDGDLHASNGQPNFLSLLGQN